MEEGGSMERQKGVKEEEGLMKMMVGLYWEEGGSVQHVGCFLYVFCLLRIPGPLSPDLGRLLHSG